MNAETHAGILVATPSLVADIAFNHPDPSQPPLPLFLQPRETRGLEGRGGGGGCRWVPNLPSHTPFSFVVCYPGPRTGGGVGLWSVQLSLP